MVRLARTGGEANSIAIRIARAASGKDKLHFVDIMAGMIGIYQQIIMKEMNCLDIYYQA